jgi:hypothetical protein
MVSIIASALLNLLVLLYLLREVRKNKESIHELTKIVKKIVEKDVVNTNTKR